MNLLARQVPYLSATTPLASRPGAAPGPLGFGDQAAQLVPGLRNWCGCREWASQALQVRCPRRDCRYHDVQCTRLDCRAQAPTWQADILLLNHSRRKVKGRQQSVATGPMPFYPEALFSNLGVQQRTNTSWLSIDTNPRFHGGSFGV